MATDAYFGNPNIARQGAKARQMAQARSVSNIADPRTYGFMQGLLGTAPDELGYSVFDNPETKQAAQRAAEIGLIGGGLLQGLPVIGPAVKGYGRLLGSEINKAMLGEGGLLGPITPQVMYVVPPGKGIKQINLNQGIYKPDLTMDEMLKVKDIPTVDRVRQSINLVGEKEFENMVNSQYKKYKPTNPEQEAMLVESVTLNILGKAQRSPYPQQTALDLAQKRAALPIEQGGLGLPADNTPQMRARAMNYTNEMFHETSGKNIEDGLLGFDVKRVGAAASDEQTPYAMFLKPHGQNIGVVKNQISQMPVLVKSNLTDENILRAFGNREELQNYLNQFPEIKQATQAVRKLDDQMADYIDQISKKADDLYAQGKTAEAEKLLDSTNINSNLMKEFDARTNELAALSKQKITDLFKSQGVGTVGLTNDTGAFGKKTITEMVLNPAENVRSRFAAFDPFRKDVATATAMGVALPDLLAAEPPKQYQPSGLLYPLP